MSHRRSSAGTARSTLPNEHERPVGNGEGKSRYGTNRREAPESQEVICRSLGRPCPMHMKSLSARGREVASQNGGRGRMPRRHRKAFTGALHLV